MARIVRTDRELELPGVDAALRAAGHQLVLLPDGVTEDELLRELRDADVLLTCYASITERMIDAARRLKGIIKYGVGIDAIDIAAARERGIPVANVPEYAEQTVAEGAFALLIALAKKLKPIQRAMERDGWIWPRREWLASDLAGKTVGVIGLGRIGSSFARMAAAFRMRVLAYDPHVSQSTHADLRMMLAECDFVSIHCVLNAETRHLIGEPELRAMKPTAFLVNVSRGAIVDEAALLRALEAETLERCREVLEGRPVTVRSRDPRLRAQTRGVRFV